MVYAVTMEENLRKKYQTFKSFQKLSAISGSNIGPLQRIRILLKGLS